MDNPEYEKKVNRLIRELLEIGEKYIDKDKEIVFYTSITGQECRQVEVLEGHGAFFENDSAGKSFPNPRVIEIGWELFNLGGLELMRYVNYQVKYQFGYQGAGLSAAWHKRAGNWVH